MLSGSFPSSTELPRSCPTSSTRATQVRVTVVARIHTFALRVVRPGALGLLIVDAPVFDHELWIYKIVIEKDNLLESASAPLAITEYRLVEAQILPISCWHRSGH